MILLRYCGPCNDDDGLLYAEFAAAHAATVAVDPAAYMVRWAADWTLQVPANLAGRLADSFVVQPRKLTADEAGKALRVTIEERRGAGLTTIGALGETSADRKRRRKEREAERKAAVRAAAGRKSRAELALTSVAAKAREEGVSRSTLYRRQKRLAEKCNTQGDTIGNATLRGTPST